MSRLCALFVATSILFYTTALSTGKLFESCSEIFKRTNGEDYAYDFLTCIARKF